MAQLQSILSYCLANPVLLALMLIVGFVLLVKGADWLVAGASAVAKRYGVSDLVIGLTVVALGTSMPEFVVNMVSVADGATDLAITNILGSNIINICVILGLTALVYPVKSQKRSRLFDIPMSVLAVILVLIFVLTSGISSTGRNIISRPEGIFLLLVFLVYMTLTFRNARDNKKEKDSKSPVMPLSKALLLVVVGLIGLALGGEMIVKSAVQIATNMGVSQAVIGLTIVALGTSLPELATSVIAAWRKNSDIALGNVVGSNIFNVFFVLGISATIRPLPAYDGIAIDVLCAALGSVLVWLFVVTNREREIKRFEGAILLIVYAIYLAYRLLQIQ